MGDSIPPHPAQGRGEGHCAMFARYSESNACVVRLAGPSRPHDAGGRGRAGRDGGPRMIRRRKSKDGRRREEGI